MILNTSGLCILRHSYVLLEVIQDELRVRKQSIWWVRGISIQASIAKEWFDPPRKVQIDDDDEGETTKFGISTSKDHFR